MTQTGGLVECHAYTDAEVRDTVNRSIRFATVEDRLPFMGPLDYADTNAMRSLGDHLSRNRSRLTFSSICRGKDGSLVLHTVLTRLSP
jgi:hypothetical protein